MSNPFFPNVPIAPGVPPVNRINAGISSVIGVSMLVGDLLGFLFGSTPKWGVFTQGGAMIAQADSVKVFDYRHHWRIANYPMEQGAFQSYNKVQTPFDTTVTLIKTGTVAQRGAFLNALETAANTTNLYNVVTPEVTYTNVSIEYINYKREARNGATLLSVELGLREIRITTPATLSNTKSPNGASRVLGGVVQSAPVQSIVGALKSSGSLSVVPSIIGKIF